jgi:hypothetical protein
MAEFLKLGRLRINVDSIMAVTEETDGTVAVRGTQTQASFPPDEGAIILEYVDGNLAGGKSPPAAHGETHHGKGKHA